VKKIQKADGFGLKIAIFFIFQTLSATAQKEVK
jgi:hypothetical protein